MSAIEPQETVVLYIIYMLLCIYIYVCVCVFGKYVGYKYSEEVTDTDIVSI